MMHAQKNRPEAAQVNSISDYTAQQPDPETLRTEIPALMQAARRWLLWRSIPQPGKKPRKVAFYGDGTARRGTLDTPADTARLVDLETALAAMERGRYSGLGFALGPGGNGSCWQGIDLDDLDRRPELSALAALLPGYVERSPSGNGVHALGIGPAFDALGSNATGIEAYSAGRYFTVTGDAIGGDLEDLAPHVRDVLAPRHGVNRTTEPDKVPPVILTPAQITELRSALNAISADDYSVWVAMGHALACLGPAGRELWLSWSQTSDKWQPEDARRWATFSGDRTGYQAVFAEAQRCGWVNPASHAAQLPAANTPARQSASFANTEGSSTPPPALELIASEDELASARLAPRCIVERYLYADVGQIVAPGGVGKTTIKIYESIRIALGLPVWGLRVESPGWSLIVTAEDRREQILARLRELLNAMDLTADQRAKVLRSIRIWDVTGNGLKLVIAVDGNVVVAPLADAIVEAYKDDPPAVVVFDPLVSFGASEGMVNDNEQGLITAARRIVRGLDCCVQLIHHTGKGNARGETLDQYSGRGGSALADGSRMTTVLQSWHRDSKLTPPPACTLSADSSLTVLARAKLSYAPPNLPHIWIKRNGFEFQSYTAPPPSAPEQLRAANADQIERFLVSQLKDGRRHTRTTLEACAEQLGLRQKEVRAAIAELQVSGRVVDADLPQEMRKGGRKSYLYPVAVSDRVSGHEEQKPMGNSVTPTTPSSYRGCTPDGVRRQGASPHPRDPVDETQQGATGLTG